ncbi:MAG TPA: DnaJ domain-containing protein [Bryobacterales bacterium]|nr:DnaJ domain-containing protein [Bryobacterales bacterium]
MENGSFIDYYEVLQVSANADVDTIQRVYRMLAQRYHPDNKETGDEEAFKQVLEAYKILSDPERRAAYDLEHRTERRLWWKIFDQPESARGMEAEKRKRQGILLLLYTKRMHQPEQPGLTIRQIEDLLGCPREHLEFGLWFLRETKNIERSDNGKWVITVKGAEVAEASGEPRVAETHMLPAPPENAKTETVNTWVSERRPTPTV